MDSLPIWAIWSTIPGAEPNARKVASIEEAGELIAAWAEELIKKERIGSHEICVTPVHDGVRTALAAREIGYLELQARRVDPGKAEPGVRLGSMRRIKGLEFKAVAMLVDSSADGAKRLERYVAGAAARPRSRPGITSTAR
jgi:hypothetical protein